MRLSIIVPAYNEEKVIAACVRSVTGAVRHLDAPDLWWELIVVDNGSTDATARIATREGASVVFEPVRQISRSRNAGARAARGDWFLFVDADSRLSGELLQSIVGAIRREGCAAGGALLRFDEAPWWGRLLELAHVVSAPLAKVGAGPCLFVEREAFTAVGGFDESMYAAEELRFSWDVKTWAKTQGKRFTVIRRPRIVTSGRRFTLNTFSEVARAFVGAAFAPHSRQRCWWWYDGRR